jgi:xanthine dehydrogenase accessory factor
MSQQFFARLSELSSSNQPFAVATVIETLGSASAKPGFKAIIDSRGRMILGWIGGGCAESAVCREALVSIKDGKTRVITLDLNDEVFGVGMPCGGAMKVYIEPFLPKPELVIAGHGRIAEMLAQLGALVGFSVTVADPGATPEAFPAASCVIATDLSSADIQVGTNSYVVIATQHKGDHLAIKKVLEGHPRYIALIASRKRSQLVLDYLRAAGVLHEQTTERRVRAPAGLDIGAQTPEEIALSIVSEVVAVRRGGTGRPMLEVKPIEPVEGNPDLDKLDRVLSTCAPVAGESGESR